MTTHAIHKTKVKIIHFFNEYVFSSKNSEKNQDKHNTPYYTPDYLSSDDDDYYQPDIFAQYTQEYREKPPRPNQVFKKTNFIHKSQLTHKITNQCERKIQPIHNHTNQ